METVEREVSQALIDKYRDINVDNQYWYLDIYAIFRQDMDAVGIEVDHIYFSGFSSQGDGACFEGGVTNWKLFLQAHGYSDKILQDFACSRWLFSVNHSGHYNHEYCTHFDTEVFTDKDSCEDYAIWRSLVENKDNELKIAAWVAIIGQYDAENMEKEFVDIFRSYMRDLYRRLEEEYDYLTSDEAVKETIIANDLE
jgi:hypothetical protein